MRAVNLTSYISIDPVHGPIVMMQIDDMAPVVYVAGGLDKYFDMVKDAVSGEVPDLTTKKGRDRIASLAAQVSRSKTAVEKPEQAIQLMA